MKRNRQLEDLLLKMNKSQIESLQNHFDNGATPEESPVETSQAVSGNSHDTSDDDDAFSNISW